MKRTAILSLLLFLSITSFAQIGSVSPYSRYGIGELQNTGLIQNFSMGSIGSALQNDTMPPLYINTANPASYSTNRITTFEAGASFNSTLLKSSTQQHLINNPALSYLSICMPVKKWWGTSFGLMPYSSMGYKIHEERTLDSIGKVDYYYEGQGGINKVYWGNGFKLLNNFYMGFNAYYLFGSLSTSRKVVFPDSPTAPRNFFNTKSFHNVSVNDFNFDYGLQYAFNIDSLGKRNLVENVKIVLGATISFGKELSSKSSISSVNFFQNAFGYEVTKDTVEHLNAKSGYVPAPLTYSAGIAFQKGNKWVIGLDYKMLDWKINSVFADQINIAPKPYLVDVANLSKSSSYNVGAQYFNGGKGKYMSKVLYRAGARYTDSYFTVNGHAAPEYALSIGMGFPIGPIRPMMRYSLLNVGVEVGKRGSTGNGMIEEQFVRVLIGITANDRWFIKSKFD